MSDTTLALGIGRARRPASPARPADAPALAPLPAERPAQVREPAPLPGLMDAYMSVFRLLR